MNQHELQELLDSAWRRPLTAGELAEIQRWCAEHPDQKTEIELDLQAARCTQGLPNVAVPSNFMSQIWREIDRPVPSPSASSGHLPFLWNWRVWIPRFAVATLVIGGGMGAWQYRQTAQRTQVASGFQQVFQAASVPDPAMLKDFDSLRLVMETPGSLDVELLAALQ